MPRFELREDHVTLLRAMYVGWTGCEFGAPEIDPKRPYGDGNVTHSIAELLSMELFEDADGEKHLSPEQDKYVRRLHRETQLALQVVLRTGAFEPGVYVCDEYRTNWRAA